jgi:hypothetical protein
LHFSFETFFLLLSTCTYPPVCQTFKIKILGLDRKVDGRASVPEPNLPFVWMQKRVPR